MPNTKQNILLITSDQQHWRMLGRFNKKLRTPNLDALSREGVLFTRAYCPNPTCTPTRSSMITGKYPSQHGAWSLGTKLPEDERTLPAILGEAGWRTSLIGKAHFQQLQTTDEFPSIESYPIMHNLEYWRNFHGPFYGFEHVELARNHADEAHVGQHYAIWMEENGLPDWRDHFWSLDPERQERFPRQRRKWSLPEKFHYNNWIAERSVARMQEHKTADEPFFLWASFFDPHPPYLAPEPWDSAYDPQAIDVPKGRPGEHDANPPHFQMTQEERPDFGDWKEEGGHAMHGCHTHRCDRDELAKDVAVYYGMTELMDKYIGRILDGLDELGLRENTLIVFTSDHGHLFGQHDLIAKGPFHYEDLLRVPMIAAQPGRLPRDQKSDALQSLVDFAPTILGWCGLDVPEEMTGVDQTEDWEGGLYGERQQVIVENRHQPTTQNLRTFINEAHKLTIYYGREYGELFDLQADPDEHDNLWDDPEYADLKASLMELMLIAEVEKEEPLDDEARRRPNKPDEPLPRQIVDGDWTLTIKGEPLEIRLWQAQPEGSDGKRRDRTHDASVADTQRRLVRELLDARLAAEPLWMPRVAVA